MKYFITVFIFLAGIVLCVNANTKAEINFKNSFIVKKNKFVVLDQKKTKNFNILKKNGDYATASLFGNNEEINWAKHFDIVELGGIDDANINYKLLQKKGNFPNQTSYCL